MRDLPPSSFAAADAILFFTFDGPSAQARPSHDGASRSMAAHGDDYGSPVGMGISCDRSKLVGREMAPDDPKSALSAAEQAATGAEEKILLRQLFEGVPAEDLEGLAPASLARLARAGLAFLSERRLGRAKVAITNP